MEYISQHLPTIIWIFSIIMLISVNIGYINSILKVLSGAISAIVRLSRIEQSLREHNIDLHKVHEELIAVNKLRLKEDIDHNHNLILINRARFRKLCNHADFGIYECDPSGKCIWVNNKICEIFGVSSDEILEYGWYNHIDEEERQDLFESWQKSVEEGLPFSDTYTVINEEKKIRVRCKTACQPIKNEKDEVIVFLGIVETTSLPNQTH